MKVFFAGTPDFAAKALEALVAAGHEVVLVLTQPDRPAGRGMKLKPSAVKESALRLGLPLWQPENLKDADALAQLQKAQRDGDAVLMVVAAYGLLLPLAVLEAFPLGCINIHASLLPRWRGAAPIQRAILAGDAQSGVCLMQMDVGLDTGKVLARSVVPLSDEENAGSLHDKLAAAGAQLLCATLPNLPQAGVAQAEEGVTYAHKISKSEAALDWTQSADDVLRRIRAFNPFPGAYTQWHGQVLKIWQAQKVELSDSERRRLSALPAGVCCQVAGDCCVRCGTDEQVGAIKVLALQKAGGKRLSIAQFCAGTAWTEGEALA